MDNYKGCNGRCTFYNGVFIKHDRKCKNYVNVICKGQSQFLFQRYPVPVHQIQHPQ